jgi:hypothetical protein
LREASGDQERTIGTKVEYLRLAVQVIYFVRCRTAEK